MEFNLSSVSDKKLVFDYLPDIRSYIFDYLYANVYKVGRYDLNFSNLNPSLNIELHFYDIDDVIYSSMKFELVNFKINNVTNLLYPF